VTYCLTCTGRTLLTAYGYILRRGQQTALVSKSLRLPVNMALPISFSDMMTRIIKNGGKNTANPTKTSHKLSKKRQKPCRNDSGHRSRKRWAAPLPEGAQWATTHECPVRCGPGLSGSLAARGEPHAVKAMVRTPARRDRQRNFTDEGKQYGKRP